MAIGRVGGVERLMKVEEVERAVIWQFVKLLELLKRNVHLIYSTARVCRILLFA